MSKRPVRPSRPVRKTRAARALPNKSAYTRKTGQRWDPGQQLEVQAMAEATLPNGAPRYYFTMHNLPKIGFNPQARYDTTPSGVYTYPLTVELYAQFLANELPYVSDAKHITVLEALEPNKMLYITQSPRAIATIAAKERRRGKYVPSYSDAGHLYRRIQTASLWGNGVPWPDEKLWEKDGKRTGSVAIFARALLQAGFTSVSDAGTGTIHTSEPAQCVFLTPKSYRVLETYESKGLRKGDAIQPKTFAQLEADLNALTPAYVGLALLYACESAADSEEFLEILRVASDPVKTEDVEDEEDEDREDEDRPTFRRKQSVLPGALEGFYTSLGLTYPTDNMGDEEALHNPSFPVSAAKVRKLKEFRKWVRAADAQIATARKNAAAGWSFIFNEHLWDFAIFPEALVHAGHVVCQIRVEAPDRAAVERSIGVPARGPGEPRLYWGVLTSDKGWVTATPTVLPVAPIGRMASWDRFPFPLRPVARGEMVFESNTFDADVYEDHFKELTYDAKEKLWAVLRHAVGAFRKGDSKPLETINAALRSHGAPPLVLRRSYVPWKSRMKGQMIEQALATYAEKGASERVKYYAHNPTYSDLMD